MRVDYTPEQRAIRAEFRAYVASLMTPEVRRATHGAEAGPEYRRVIRQMGKDGWLTPGWPKEYGGKGWTRRRKKFCSRNWSWRMRHSLSLPSTRLVRL